MVKVANKTERREPVVLTLPGEGKNGLYHFNFKAKGIFVEK